MSPDKITKDVVVSFLYSLKLADGSLVEEADPKEPLVYLHGHSNIIPGLESELENLAVGDQKSVVVAAEDAYGEYNPDAVEEIPLEALPPDLEPAEGLLLTLIDEDGNSFLAEIVEVDEEAIVVDLNHPMAGQELHFDVTIVELRAASEEELSHGHVHGPEGHHH